VTITKVVELEATGGTKFILPDATPEAVAPYAWMKPHFVDEAGRLRMSSHALVIETPSRRIIVDTCLGNGKTRPFPGWGDLQTAFLSDLERAGFARESVDRVLCTHLHFDHVGWNTMQENGRWVPTFPRARYLVAEQEWSYWKDADDPYAPQAKQDSIVPIFEAGLVDLVGPELEITPEVRLIPTPGHTPGHVSVLIQSRGYEAVITGDMIHHPLQMARPEWKDSADVQSERAHATRVAFLERFADRPVLVLGTHFATPTGGRVVRDGKSFRFVV
jgi:glyoxylase-like metal-dependent hydrolase (beta-lactamase superfamily II)